MKTVPITLLTGFLGSGKSTLINRILAENKNLKIGLIVNEFGDVALESEMINSTKEEVVELSNGCMCCVVRSDIIEAVKKLLDSPKKVDYIIVEASGLSDPIPIAQTFLMNNVDGRIRLDAILGVVDTLNFQKNMDNFQIALTQLQAADIILLSKTDLIKAPQLEKIKELIAKMIPNVAMHDLTKKLPLKSIIDTSAFDHSELEELEVVEQDHEEQHDEKHESDHDDEHECEHCHHECDEECDHEHHDHHHHHHEHVDTVFFKTDKPFDYKKFAELMTVLPGEIVRAKGFVYFGDSVDKDLKYILQYVGSRRQLQMKEWRSGEKKQSALVFIGTHFDKKKLERKLTECLA
ncbi:MAG TPA: GTP-binding protein [Acidobacteriota bacterium]|nr:GTP-binding protein [Acidobacteriota bacterium]